MTNEETIEVLDDMKIKIAIPKSAITQRKRNEALDMAIKALGIASCIKEKCAYCPHCENCDVDDDTLEIKALDQQPCEDTISSDSIPREKLETAKKMIKARFMDSGETVMQNETRRAVCREFIKILEEVCR